MSVVYFIQSGADGPIKIGFAKNLQKRLIGLSCSSPELLTVLATLPGGRDLERRIHRALHASKRRLEWFNPTQEVRGVIVLANHKGLEAVNRWLDVKEQEVEIRPLDFTPTGDRRADFYAIQKMVVRNAVARNGIEAVAEAIERSRDRVESLMSRDTAMPVTCLFQLAQLDPGACAPIFALAGQMPDWISKRASEQAIDELLSRIGPKGVDASLADRKRLREQGFVRLHRKGRA